LLPGSGASTLIVPSCPCTNDDAAIAAMNIEYSDFFAIRMKNENEKNQYQINILEFSKQIPPISRADRGREAPSQRVWPLFVSFPSATSSMIEAEQFA
jgi:hypothetical protein